MEKIIVAIRTLNDNLKIVATRVEDLEKRVDAIAARIDGVGGSLTDSVHNLSAQTEARLAELTERIYALENTAPTVVGGDDDIGDALDDILGGVVEQPTSAVEDETVEEPTPTPAPAPTPTAEEEKPTMCPNVDEFIAECLGQTVAATTPTVATPTPTEKKTPAKTKAVVASAVQRRAYARQYMVEHGAKVEDLRSPAKIEEVMQTEEFQKWAESTILMTSK